MADEDTGRDIWTPVGRSFYFNGEPKEKKGKDGPYQVWEGLLILDLDRFTEVDKALWASMCGKVNEISKVAFGKPWKDLPDNIRKGIRNGNERPDSALYAGNTRFINVKSYFVPKLIAADKSILTPGTPAFAQYVYHGAYSRYKVRPKAYTFKDDNGITSKGINFTMLYAQFFPGAEQVEQGQTADDAPEDDAWLTKASGEAIDDIGF